MVEEDGRDVERVRREGGHGSDAVCGEGEDLRGVRLVRGDVLAGGTSGESHRADGGADVPDGRGGGRGGTADRFERPLVPSVADDLWAWRRGVRRRLPLLADRGGVFWRWSGSVLYCGEAAREANGEADEGEVDVGCFFNMRVIRNADHSCFMKCEC